MRVEPSTIGRLLLLLPVLAAAGKAQLATDATTESEKEFATKAAEDLGSFAGSAFKGGFVRLAREVWSEVLFDYDPDDTDARTALGFKRLGRSWAPDSTFVYPNDDSGDARQARTLQSSWDKLAKKLGEGHLDLADELEAAGEPGRAGYHRGRALRFVAQDKKLAKRAANDDVGGDYGDAVQIAIRKRSEKIDKAMAEALSEEPKVESLGSEKFQAFTRSRVEHSGVRSEHFTVWGDWPEEDLMRAAREAERALVFLEAAIGEGDGFGWKNPNTMHLAVFKKQETYQQIVRANESSFGDQRRFEFIVEKTSSTAMGSGSERVSFGRARNQANIDDLAVRWTAGVYGGFGSDALREGFGHAVVGWFYGRNLTFSVGLEDEVRTSTGRDRKSLIDLPDVEGWKEAVRELAWTRTDLPTGKLANLKAARFSSELRVKVWSLCSYLVRRDPSLLRLLDDVGRELADANPSGISEEYAERADGLTTELLDEQWRSYVTGTAPILQRARARGVPLSGSSKAAPQFLEQINGMRTGLEKEALRLSAHLSNACAQHAHYLKENRSARGAEAEHTQDLGKGKGSLEGAAFARRALVSTAAKSPKKTFDRWLLWPGYRDALLDDRLEEVGLFVDKGILVLDVRRGMKTATAKNTLLFPRGVEPGRAYPQGGAPLGFIMEPEIDVAELGPDVKELLERNGHRRTKTVGTPISLHFFRSNAMPANGDVSCVVLKNGDAGQKVGGVIHYADSGVSRRACAPGLVVFYPLEPLARGAAYTVEWTITQDGKANTQKPYQFFTR